MKVIDDGIEVDVANEECPNLACYWPNQHHGRYIPGGAWEYWCCGTRETIDCPDDPIRKENG